MILKALKYLSFVTGAFLLLSGAYLMYAYSTLPAITGTEPSLSTDCSTVVFASDRSGMPEFFEFSFLTRQVTPLTREKTTKHYPVLSPDGKTVAYSRRVKGNWFVSVLDIESGETTDLDQTHTINPIRPAWVGNGKLIFTTEASGERELVLFDLESRTRQQINSV